MLTLLRRFEIWLLFLLVAGALWWAFQEDNSPEVVEVSPTETSIEGKQAEQTTEVESEALLEVKNVQLHADEQGTMVELTLLGRSGTEESVALNTKNVELLTTEGDVVNPFFLPFSQDPVLSADSRSLVTLKYWLKQPTKVLWLTYRDQTLKVELPSA